MDIKGTGAVVTGAGSGIGRGIALALAEAGDSGGNSLLGYHRFLA